MRPAVIGKDGRTTAIRKALLRSRNVEGNVPILSEGKGRSAETMQKLLNEAESYKPDFVFIGPEEPLDLGVVDLLQSKLGIPCVGPTRTLARLESSKAFTRELVSRYGIPGNPEHRVFRSIDGMAAYLRRLDGFVVKPDGLTGGKGVKVSGAHLQSIDEAIEYAAQLFAQHHAAVIVEEKLEGEEFSLMSFCDGSHVVDMPIVQDHKRAWVNDEGPNTGGMGSYTWQDHRLPFLREEDVRDASAINKAVAHALFQETGNKYKGILYGGFMLTRNGVRLIEYNARFGDPEALNVLSILRSDFGAICTAILDETLNGVEIRFDPFATVCKYVVPQGYPESPIKGQAIDLTRVPPESTRLRHYIAALDQRNGDWIMTGSRAIAFVGIGVGVREAEQIAEEAASAVGGRVYHRADIGTHELIQRRCERMERLRQHRST